MGKDDCLGDVHVDSVDGESLASILGIGSSIEPLALRSAMAGGHLCCWTHHDP